MCTGALRPFGYDCGTKTAWEWISTGEGKGMRRWCSSVRTLAFAMAIAITAPVAADSAFTPLTVPQPPTNYVLQGFPVHQQWWGLSCEYAATSAATLYLDRYVSEAQFRDGIALNPNPNKGFRGNIYGEWGGTSDYGIYPAPLLAFLLERGFRMSYAFQADPTLLRDAVSHNRPVVAWIDGTFGGAPGTTRRALASAFFSFPTSMRLPCTAIPKRAWTSWTRVSGQPTSFHGLPS